MLARTRPVFSQRRLTFRWRRCLLAGRFRSNGDLSKFHSGRSSSVIKRGRDPPRVVIPRCENMLEFMRPSIDHDARILSRGKKLYLAA